MAINGRTDMASEAHRDYKKGKALPGVSAREETLNGFPLYSVEIKNEDGAQALRKPVGKYYTLEPERFFERGSDSFAPAAQAVAQQNQHLIGVVQGLDLSDQNLLHCLRNLRDCWQLLGSLHLARRVAMVCQGELKESHHELLPDQL